MTRWLLFAPLVGWILIFYAGDLSPFEVGHSLSDHCKWAERPVLGLLTRQRADAEALDDEYACWARHGDHSRTALPVVRTILAKWPSPEQLAAWNSPGENDHPLPARK